MSERFEANWRSLRLHVMPQWLRDAKFGIYTHWGVYSVPACGPNGTWYPYNMYRAQGALGNPYATPEDGNPQFEHHVKVYGGATKFTYKDFIPQFTAARFDPAEWADLFKQAGAKFAGPVGEHCDGFAMWKTELTEWNAAVMGPRRDIVRELEQAIRAEGLRFMVSLHHAENWWWYPHWVPEYDTSDPRYAKLYGPLHNVDGDFGPPAEAYDHPWSFFYDQDPPSKEFLDLWLAKTREIIDLFQPDLLWFDAGLERIQEHYRLDFLTHYYNQALAWGKDVVATYKHHSLVPGTALVNLELGRFGALTYHEWLTDTSIDDQAAWSYVEGAGFKPVATLVHNLIDNVSKNGYLLLNVGPRADGTIPELARDRLRGIGAWLAVNGEAIYGTTPWLHYGEGPTRMGKAGPFSEGAEVYYTSQDIRFTAKDDTLYAICLGWPDAQVTIKTLNTGIMARNALYPKEIRSISMLGDDRKLDWRMTPEGLIITPPSEKPCEHAYVFKIERGQPF